MTAVEEVRGIMRNAARRIGAAGFAGMIGLLAAVWLHLMQSPIIEHERLSLAAQVERLQRDVDDRRTGPTSPPEAQVRGIEPHLATQTDIPMLIAEIGGELAARGVALSGATYESAGEHDARRLPSYRIRLRAEGRYLALRELADHLLLEWPGLAMTRFDVSRAQANPAHTIGQIEFELFLRREP